MRHGVDPAVPVVTFQPISRPERTTILDPSGNHPFSATATRAPLAGVRLVLAIAVVAVSPTLACRADQAAAGSTAGPPPPLPPSRRGWHDELDGTALDTPKGGRGTAGEGGGPERHGSHTHR